MEPAGRRDRRNDVDNVYLTPQAGGEVAALCEHAAAQLATHLPKLTGLADGIDDGWLGDCEEGRGWARLLREKAVGANSLRRLLETHIGNLAVIAAEFRRSTGQYAEVDRRHAEQRWLSG